MALGSNTAVMASRRSGPGTLNYFPTPPWATRALIWEILRPHSFFPLDGLSAADTCCGAGHMAIPLKEVFSPVFASDVHDWGYGDRRNLDFTFATRRDLPFEIDWFILNPPFPLAEEMLDTALRFARVGVAMLLRLQWFEGEERHRLIFGTDRRPNLFCPFAERVPMIEGCWDPEASSATAYAWFVWFKDKNGRQRNTLVEHLPPGMKAKYSRFSDEDLANRGEAKRRRAAKAHA